MYFSCIDGFFFKGRFFPYPRYFVSFLYSLIEFEIYQGERESIGNIFFIDKLNRGDMKISGKITF